MWCGNLILAHVKIKKALLSALIAWHLFTLFIEGIPSSTVLHDHIGQWLSPYMNFVAQHQGSFAFFAPVPDKMNLHLEAEMDYADGTKGHWRSPDWKKLTLSGKLIQCRVMKLIENVRRDDQERAWADFADYLVREERKSGKQVRHIEISRHWVEIPPPADRTFNRLVDLPHTQQFTFFRKDYPR